MDDVAMLMEVLCDGSREGISKTGVWAWVGRSLEERRPLKGVIFELRGKSTRF